MPSGINIGVGADTRAFASGVQKGLITPLEDAQDTLKDLAQTGDAATTDLEAQFRDQQRATVDYGREYQRMSDDIKRSSRATNRSVQSDARETVQETSEGFDEIKDSARSNAIETAASFDGSFDSISGGVQGLLSEFLVGFGPAGILAGLVAAGGVGLLTQAIEGGTEAAEAQKEAVADLGQEYIAAGRSGRRSFDSITAAISEMATAKPEDVIITLADAWADAKESGADYSEVIEAIASRDPQRIAEARKGLERFNLEQQRAKTGAEQYGSASAEAALKSAQGAGKLDDALEEAEKQAREAGRAQKLAAEAGLSDFQLKADLIGQLEDRFDDAAAGADHFNKKTGEFEVGPFLKDVRKVRRELKEYQTDIAKSDLSAEARKFIESQGAESAAAMLRGYKKAGPKQKAELNEIWSTAGNENATSYEEALGTKISGLKVKAPKIDTPIVPTPDTAALDRYLAKPEVKRIVLEGVTRNGTRVF